ncbi:MAG: ParA family protein [Alphaproteobacteria bacterium]
MSHTKKVRILAIANQKGGVGKTTTAINLATALAAVGKKVVLLDLDPQGNATTGLGIDRQSRDRGSYELMTRQLGFEETIVPTEIPRLSVIPSSVHLSGAEIELVNFERREYQLQEAFLSCDSLDVDYVLIDCPPSLGLLTLNALVAADSVLVPLQCEFFALEGLSQLVSTIRTVQKRLNTNLDIQGIVLTMHDLRNNLSRQVEEDVRAHFGETVYQTVIPRNVRIAESASHGKPILIYDYKCKGSLSYIHLAKEVIKREKKLTDPTVTFKQAV